jgi:polyhydroxybutyrate depolymerase
MQTRWTYLALLVATACGSSSPTAATGADSGTLDATVDAATDSRVESSDSGGTEAGRLDSGTTSDSSPVDAIATDGGSDAPLGDASVACGTRTGMRGMTNRTLMVAGLTRTYIIYLPASFDPTTPIPFVFVFHGYTMSGQSMVDITQYQALADSQGIGLAFPDGEGGPNSLAAPWNVENPGQSVCGDGQLESASGNDFAFIDAMKADVSNDQCLDTPHIYATGFSMGGYFSHHIGCYRDDIRAVAPGSGGTLADLSACTTGHVPVIIFHGAADPLISDGCDDPTAVPVAGFPASATLWAAKNGCKNTYTTLPTDGDGGGAGQCFVYDDCPSDGQVEVCTFTGMGHCWAGGSPTGTGAEFGCPTYASATQLQWSFFKQYAW